MWKEFSSGETCKGGVKQERKGLNEDGVSSKFQPPQPGPGRLWGIHYTTGLSSSKQGNLAVVLLPLSAFGCGLFPFYRNFLGEAALSSGRKFSRAGGR